MIFQLLCDLQRGYNEDIYKCQLNFPLNLYQPLKNERDVDFTFAF